METLPKRYQNFQRHAVAGFVAIVPKKQVEIPHSRIRRTVLLNTKSRQVTNRAKKETQMKVERSGFPRTGNLLSLIKFLTETPVEKLPCVFVGPVKDKPGDFNFCLFAAPVTPSKEQADILAALDAVTRAAQGIANGSSANGEAKVGLK